MKELKGLKRTELQTIIREMEIEKEKIVISNEQEWIQVSGISEELVDANAKLTQCYAIIGEQQLEIRRINDRDRLRKELPW